MTASRKEERDEQCITPDSFSNTALPYFRLVNGLYSFLRSWRTLLSSDTACSPALLARRSYVQIGFSKYLDELTIKPKRTKCASP